MRTTLTLFLFIFSFTTNIFASTGHHGNEMTRIEESWPLYMVLQAISDARYDLNGYYDVSQRIDFATKTPNCKPSKAADIVGHIEEAIEHYREFYPDEELPYAAATADLKAIVGDGAYEKCQEHVSSGEEDRQILHYIGQSKDVIIRIEYNVLKKFY